MTLHSIIKRAERIVSDNSPAIMTGIGVVGSLTATYLSGRATFKAAELILSEDRDRRLKNEEPMTPREKVDMTWKLYIPTLSVATVTCAAIVMANRVSTKRATAVATAYALSERAYDEYRTKVVEKMGENKEREIREEIAQDRVRRAGASSIVVADGSGKVLCHDAFSNQFFTSDMETIRKAMNDINRQIIHHDYATVSDLYEAIRDKEIRDSAPENTTISSEMGWNSDNLLEIDFQTVLYDERVPCLSMVFAVVPIRDPWRFL